MGRSLKDARCEEVTLPKSVGNGFFLQLQSNGNYKPLPFPWWDLVVFHGFADNIKKYKSEMLPTVAVCSTAPSPATPASLEYLNVQYAPTLTATQLAEAKLLVSRFPDVFDDTNLAGRIVGVECDIDTGDHAPLSCQPFQVSPAKRVKIDAKIDRMVQLGVIEPSTSPWASRFFLVSQPGKEDREVVDYCPLNGVTKREVYPLPRKFG